jgi:NTE family protein
MKRALVLSGGGSKGAYQVGVLKKWLLDDKRDYDIVCGVSVGALNTGAICQTRLGNPEEAYKKLAEIWDHVENRKIRKFWFLWYLAALWKPSVYDSSPLEKWVRSELDPEAIQNSGRKVRIGAVNWSTGEYCLATENSNRLTDWVLASASFPAFFKPIEIDGDLWTDGGVRNVTPVGAAIRAGAEEIDVIMCSSPGLGKPWNSKGKNALSLALRAIEIQADEIVCGDLKEAGLKNDLAERGADYKKVRIRIQRPESELIDDSLDFTPSKITEMRERGYADACRR